MFAMSSKYIAHIRKSDSAIQSVETHLFETAEIAKRLAAKIGFDLCGESIGLMHDFGKFSQAFLNYINSSAGLVHPDLDEESDNYCSGKIDHSTAGAQWVYNRLKPFGNAQQIGLLCGQILGLCIASHHGSGLIDCLTPDGDSALFKRFTKEDKCTHLRNCLENADKAVLEKAESLVNEVLIKQLLKPILPMLKRSDISGKSKMFYLGCFTRFLFSCLIDADRINSADFEHQHQKSLRKLDEKPNWQIAIDTLAHHLSQLPTQYAIDETRQKISQICLSRSTDQQGIYSLTVPTGGGKTLASLRYALHHAQKHNLDRIIYIIPYTSIIDQNAETVRTILGEEWVLEHHSNLNPEKQTWQNKLLSENWDRPIVFTTMVQFLDAWFGSGTRGARHIHPMTNSILIFDEIQTLPVKCVHLFCNTLNWLTQYGGSSAILCTATQPLLGENSLDLFPSFKRTKAQMRGLLKLSPNSEIMGDLAKVNELFTDLSRVNIQFNPKLGGWSVEDAGEFLLEQAEQFSSCLFIVNTKKWAQQLYQYCQQKNLPKEVLFHLSTNQCPAHRKALFETIKQRLKQKLPVICISTQLIEAGVDISMACVIRALAGLDSIAQAAGRCNRHGENRDKGTVWVVNLKNEPLAMLPDIQQGQIQAVRLFEEFANQDILQPEAMKQYFQYYFYQRSDEMVYPIPNSTSGSLLDWLSDNPLNVGKQHHNGKMPLLCQSFKSAGKVFQAIDAPTKAVIVPYGEGKDLISILCGDYNPQIFYQTLSKAQRFSVNVFPNIWEKLEKEKALIPIADTGIYYVEERYYSDEYGLCVDEVGKMSFYEC